MRHLALAFVALLGPIVASAQDPGAPADSTEREFVSTDGAISVFKEARQGEGIDGYWWVYEGGKDLDRLTDEDLNDDLLDPLTDEFGFELIVPDSILALRDSVVAVADSILAERIDVRTDFDPKLKTTYNENKDSYGFVNEFDASLPLTNKGSVQVTTSSDLSYNEASQRSVDGREVKSTFTYRYSPEVTATATVSRADDVQQRGSVVDSDRDTTTMSGSVRASRTIQRWKLEANGGFSLSRLNYVTPSLDGNSSSLTPSWGSKATRAHDGGQLSFNYTGNVGRSGREETREAVTDSLDADLNPITEITTTNADEKNFKHDFKANFTHKFNPEWDFNVSGGFSRGQFQFISQEVEFQGRQETRTQQGQNVRGALNAKPNEKLEIRWNGELSRNDNLFDLDKARAKVTRNSSMKLDFDYSLWSGGDLLVKSQAKREDKNLNTLQSGIIDGYQFSADYKQTITTNVSFDATYLLTLDRFAFDDPDSNKGDRDLFNQRSTFVVRYSPREDLKTNVKMEVRENRTINIHRSKSGSNKTDFTYLITPNYTWTLGKASFSGEFTADVRYAVFDFQEDNNNLIRRFSTRQRWAHKFSEQFSTSLLWTYEFSDKGSYTRGADGIRRYARASELFRRRVETEVLYKPRKFLETNVVYRWDGDDNYAVDGDLRTFSSARRTEEFTYGIKLNRKFLKHVVTSLRFSHTLKNGDTVGAFDNDFYTVFASVDYQPFKKKKKKEGEEES